MNTNRVSATLLTADQEAVMTALGVIRERLPFLIDLTTAERVILPKLGDKTQPFVKKAVDIARQTSGTPPGGLPGGDAQGRAAPGESLADPSGHRSPAKTDR